MLGKMKSGLALFAAGLVLLWALPAYGKESLIVPRINIKVKDVYVAGQVQEPEVTASVPGCQLDQVAWGMEASAWTPGKRMRGHLVLTTQDKVFAKSYTSSDCRVSGASLVSAKALDNQTLEVNIDYIPVVALGATIQAGWREGSSTRAWWIQVPYATSYQLNLYRDGKRVAGVKVRDNEADLSAYMAVDGDYYYEVQATGSTSQEKRYLKDGAFVTSDDMSLTGLGTGGKASPSHGKTPGSGTPSPGGGVPAPGRGTSGGHAAHTWEQVGGRWHYYGDRGQPAQGWLKMGGRWYYLDPSGAMETGWVAVGGRWYYLSPVGGDMETGWVAVGGHWYYLDPSGAMETGWTEVGGRWYYLDPSGAMETGWVEVGGRWYYLDASGAMQTGWVQLGPGRWYYFQPDGSMAANTAIGGRKIGPDGIWPGP